jgi:periplasmic protein TonB
MLQEISARSCRLSCAGQKQNSPSGRSAASEQSGLFSRDVFVENNGYIERRATHSVFSIAIHFIAIAALMVLPLFSSADPRLSVLTRDMVVVPLPPSNKPLKKRSRAAAMTNPVLASMQLLPPLASSRSAFSEPDLPAFETVALRSSTLGSAPGSGDVLGGILDGASAELVRPVKPENPRVVHLGGEVINSRPLYRLMMPYPELAKTARVIGNVIIQAIIDESGKVIHARALSGPPLLANAAVEAVSKERFEPMLLDGEPTRCDLRVEINFQLSGM